MNCGEGCSLQGEQTFLCAAERALSLTLCWLPCPAVPELGIQDSLWASSSSPPNCQSLEKQGNGGIWGVQQLLHLVTALAQLPS